MPARTARKRKGDEGKPNMETVLAQFYIAFGQGAGSLFVEPEAIAAGRAEFENNIWPNIRRWDTAALAALEYARAVGRVSAHLAVAGGANVISVDNYRDALRMVAKTAHAPFGICPCFVHGPKPGSSSGNR